MQHVGFAARLLAFKKSMLVVNELTSSKLSCPAHASACIIVASTYWKALDFFHNPTERVFCNHVVLINLLSREIAMYKEVTLCVVVVGLFVHSV